MINKYDTFWKRFGAGIIDSLIFIPLVLIGNFFDKNNKQDIFIAWSLINTCCWALYVVIGHGRYGQTIGKRLVGIKVLDIDEKTAIGYKRAFYREGIWLLADISGLVYFIWLSDSASATGISLRLEKAENYLSGISFIWLVIELITMLFNSKRRALHDYIAGSVVLDIHEMKSEELGKRRSELMESLKRGNL